MNSQSILKEYASSAEGVKDEVYETLTIPTFPTKPREHEVEVDVKTLTDPAYADALRAADPFMYYSCFAPSKTLSSKLADRLPTAMESEDDSNQIKTVKVTRKGRVSAECEGLEFLLQHDRKEFQGAKG